MLPKHEVTTYFAFTLVVTLSGGSLNDFHEYIATRDDLDLFEDYGRFRTRQYMSDDPWNADDE